ncbi:MAG: DUF3592 domain-containing protein [Opitutales bacterium]|jgi:hypothetical protein|nr:DUF3592 domain-containing protein [Opitutales bacterium]
MDDLKPYLAFFVGGITLWRVVSLILKERRVDFWPKVRGTIFYSEVLDESGWHGSRYGFSYKADVNYRFEIDDISYKGTGIGLDENSYILKFLAQKTVTKYPKDSEVVVYYNPDDPNESYLVKGASISTYAFLTTLGFIFLGVGFYELLIKK